MAVAGKVRKFKGYPTTRECLNKVGEVVNEQPCGLFDDCHKCPFSLGQWCSLKVLYLKRHPMFRKLKDDAIQMHIEDTKIDGDALDRPDTV